MTTFLAFYYVGKMRNFQTIEIPKRANKWLRFRTKLSVDERMLKI